jgi:hypothetical protein
MPILHYDGNPITARFVTKAIGDAVNQIQERAIP